MSTDDNTILGEYKSDENGNCTNAKEDLNRDIRELKKALRELNEKLDCLQRSQALLFQILPEKIRGAIIDGLQEWNVRRSYVP